MFLKFQAMKERKESGFTLIELLVVILIIAILAAIAIPVFLNQRKKGWTSQVQSALKNAATAMETCATETNGEYDAAACGSGTIDDATLTTYGFVSTTNVDLTGSTANTNDYCIVATHSLHPDAGDGGWAVGTYDSNEGTPQPNDTC